MRHRPTPLKQRSALSNTNLHTRLETLEPRLVLSTATMLGQTINLPEWLTAAEVIEAQTAVGAVTTSTATAIRQYGLGIPGNGDAEALIGLSAFNSNPNFTGVDGGGSGTIKQSIVILDSGIDLDNPIFGPDSDNNGIADRIVAQYDFGNNDANAADDLPSQSPFQGHGTAVASIAADTAPGANIIALKIYNSALGWSFDTYSEKALQWVIAHAEQYNIVAVNMSYSTGSGSYQSFTSAGRTADEIAALSAMKVICVAAAGNANAPPYNAGIAIPAADPNVIAVGAVHDSNAGSLSYSGGGIIDYSTAPDRIAAFSQRAPGFGEVFAPGVQITTANWDGSTRVLNGTSFASPYVAGAAAIAQQLYASQHGGQRLSISALRTLLNNTGQTILDGDDEDDNVSNPTASYKRLDLVAMANKIMLPYVVSVTTNASTPIVSGSNIVTEVTFDILFSEPVDVTSGEPLFGLPEPITGPIFFSHRWQDAVVPNLWHFKVDVIGLIASGPTIVHLSLTPGAVHDLSGNAAVHSWTFELDAIPAEIAEVIIGSTYSSHDPYSIPAYEINTPGNPGVPGGEQLRTVPVSSANQITIVFDKAMVIHSDDLVLSGRSSTGSITTYSFSAFSLDPTSTVATWTLASPISDARQMSIHLVTSTTDAHRVNGNLLNGFWNNPYGLSDSVSSSYPSGNWSGTTTNQTATLFSRSRCFRATRIVTTLLTVPTMRFGPAIFG